VKINHSLTGENLAGFLSEVEITARIPKHKNIVAVIGTLQQLETFYKVFRLY
jgi:serine/threonine protein kinase